MPLLRHTDSPKIVLGDFNTPIDSVAFDPVRRYFVNALSRRPRSGPGTWPAPAPVLSLDQVWVSPELEASCADRRITWHSDHVLVRVRLSPAAATTASTGSVASL